MKEQRITSAPSPAMLARAERLRGRSRAAIELRQMDVTRLDYPAGSFDAAVSTFLFCVLPEELQITALRELCRVLKPGGPIRLLEHVRPRGRVRRLMARLWEPWMGWAYGAGFDRQTETHVPEVDLELIEARYVVDDLVKLISARDGRSSLTRVIRGLSPAYLRKQNNKSVRYPPIGTRHVSPGKRA
jgi:ubiquinone/menaquinone biosynthesis C-methylase UbiE